MAVDGLPATVSMKPGEYAKSIEGLRCATTGDLLIEVHDGTGKRVCTSNPLRIVEQATLLPYWADLHGQSEETIGTNSARELIEFARDRAFLDAMSHQGNDFQITTPFWNELNKLSKEFNADGRFIMFPATNGRATRGSAATAT
jgi:hypothetical protein